MENQIIKKRRYEEKIEAKSSIIAVRMSDKTLFENEWKTIKETEQGEKKFDSGTIQTGDVPEEAQTSIDDIQKSIPKEKLYYDRDIKGHIENGWMLRHHITLLWGIGDNEDIKNKIKNIFQKYKGLEVTLSVIGYWDDKKKNYTTVYWTVVSEDLNKLHEELKKEIPNKDTQEFRPHITIAYLKLGERLPEVAWEEIKIPTWNVDVLELSKPSGDIERIVIKEASMNFVLSMKDLTADGELLPRETQVPSKKQTYDVQTLLNFFSPTVLKRDEIDLSGAFELAHITDPLGMDIFYQTKDDFIVILAEPLGIAIKSKYPVAERDLDAFVDGITKLIPIADEFFGELLGKGMGGVSMRDAMKTTIIWKKGDLQRKLPRLVKRYLKEKIYTTEQEAIDRINMLSQADPTGSKGDYIDWIVKLDVNKTSIFPEDSDKIRDALTAFAKFKTLDKPIDRNVDSYATYGDLVKILEPFKEEVEEAVETKKEKERVKVEEGAGVEDVFNDGTYRVVKITTPEASAKVCWGTGAVHWCIKDVKWAQQYLEKGPLYFMFKNDEPYIGMSESTGNIVNFEDTPISMEMYKEVRNIISVIGDSDRRE